MANMYTNSAVLKSAFEKKKRAIWKRDANIAHSMVSKYDFGNTMSKYDCENKFSQRVGWHVVSRRLSGNGKMRNRVHSAGLKFSFENKTSHSK